MEISINHKALTKLMKDLKKWSKSKVLDDIGRSAKTVTTKYKSQIRAGLKGDNTPMVNIKNETLDMPIRWGTDPVKRGHVRSSRKPLHARGNLINSIKSRRVKNSFVIEPNTIHGKRVLETNAFTPQVKFGKKTSPRPIRDPLIVSDVQVKIIEDEIIKGLEKAIRG